MRFVLCAVAVVCAAVAVAQDDWVTREHRLAESNLTYTTTAGKIGITGSDGEVDSNMFFMAYERPSSSQRPVLFSFNGGPGSSSIWLHLGLLGPKLAKMNPDGSLPAPPYEWVENPDTPLRYADLVFIDPPGTGYSDIVDNSARSRLWSVNGDISAVAQFIRRYMTETGRWGAPAFVIGESYGTFRAAGVAEALRNSGVALHGVILLSAVLDYSEIRGGAFHDLPYALFLPTMAATAHYHGKLEGDRDELLAEVESWAMREYLPALQLGDMLEPDRRDRVARRLARYTGLSTDLVERSNLRIGASQFGKELLADERYLVGRLDSRLKGRSFRWEWPSREYDPSMDAIDGPYTTVLNAMMHNDFGYQSDVEYNVMGGVSWEYGMTMGYPETATDLRSAMTRNPHMKVLVMAGLFDLATPYYAVERTIAQLYLPPEAKANLRFERYAAGHMMYIEENELRRSLDHIEDWMKDTLR